jgi:hypothetical protein
MGDEHRQRGTDPQHEPERRQTGRGVPSGEHAADDKQDGYMDQIEAVGARAQGAQRM